VDQNRRPGILLDMQMTSANYLERADLAERNAMISDDPTTRGQFLESADQWRRLARFTDTTEALRDERSFPPIG
jgi:hypothetical protein